MAKKMVVTGSKGGSASQHTPQEMEDNLISIDKIKVLLGVSDGECDASFSLKDLYLNNVPVQNEDGTMNYDGITAEYRPGTQTQEYIKGMEDTSSEYTVQRAITTTNPYTISVTNTSLSAIRVRMYMPRGFKQESNGDQVGVVVDYAFDMAVDGGAYQEVLKGTFDGKTTSGYDRSERVNLPDFNSQVLLRVRRVTADSTTSTVVDAIQVQSYAEVIDAKFRYPLTGLVYVEYDSKTFTSTPNISVKKKWKLINVPSNYDPELREYSGTWDGTFKKAWSNNPAWVLYDLITNQRYGLDQRELGIEVDKWSLYSAGVYCDQMVPDGKGGTEPRYLCDVVIQSQVEAYQLVRDICSIFRGMSFWNGESISIVIDQPRDPSYIFTNDNVVNGSFTYTFATEKSMYTQCNVTFDDEQNMYSQDTEGVFDSEASLRFGYNPTSLTAIGCTRRSEANRRGRWVLRTNLRSTTVNFSTGLEGMIPMIGDVLAIADNFWSSNLTLSLSGRVMEVSGLQVFTHFKVDARPGDFIMVNKPDGDPVKRTISKVSADGKTIELNVGFGFDVQNGTVFAIERTDLALQKYVVSSITKGDGDDDFTYSITAVEYDENKFDAIDYGVNIDDRPTSIVEPANLGKVENVKISSYSRVVQGLSVQTMVISWDKLNYAATYDIQWRKDDGNWQNIPRTASREVEVEGIYSGNYFVRVRGVSASENASQWSDIASATLTGKVGKPNRPINVTASTNEVFGIRLKWTMPGGSGDTSYIEIHQSQDGTAENSSLLTMVPYPAFEYWHSILPAAFVNWYRLRAVDRIGNVSDWTAFVRGMATDDFDAIQNVVKIDIENSQVFKDLAASTTELASKVINDAQANIHTALANDVDLVWTKKENGKRKAEYGTALELVANEKEARVTQIEELRATFTDNIGAQLTEIRKTVADDSQALSSVVTQLNAGFQSANSSIGRLDQAVANESSARAQADTVLQANLNDANAAIARTDQALADEVSARASAITAVQASISSVSSDVGGVKNDVNGVKDDLNTVSASVTNKLDAWVDNGGIGSSYVLKLGIKRAGVEYTAGMGMSLTSVNGNIMAQTIWDVDRFAIGKIAGTTYSALPFFMENNQVFIQSAIIKDGSITNLKVGDLQSNNFVSGSAGWRITKAGGAELNNVTVRGNLIAQNGQFNLAGSGNSVVINGNGITVNLSGGGRIVLGSW